MARLEHNHTYKGVTGPTSFWAAKLKKTQATVLKGIRTHGSFPKYMKYVEMVTKASVTSRRNRPEKKKKPRTDIVWITYEGETKALGTWARERGINYETARTRYRNRPNDTEYILSQAVHKTGRKNDGAFAKHDCNHVTTDRDCLWIDDIFGGVARCKHTKTALVAPIQCDECRRDCEYSKILSIRDAVEAGVVASGELYRSLFNDGMST